MGQSSWKFRPEAGFLELINLMKSNYFRVKTAIRVPSVYQELHIGSCLNCFVRINNLSLRREARLQSCCLDHTTNEWEEPQSCVCPPATVELLLGEISELVQHLEGSLIPQSGDRHSHHRRGFCAIALITIISQSAGLGSGREKKWVKVSDKVNPWLSTFRPQEDLYVVVVLTAVGLPSSLYFL